MNRRVLKVSIAIVVLCSLIVAFGYAAGFIPSKAERKGRALAQQINQHLNKPGDWARVSEIHSGEWTQVCVHPSMSTGGTLTRRILEKKFGVATNTMLFPNGIPGASDWHWIIMFLYPPNRLEMYAVPTEDLLGSVLMANDQAEYPGCRSRDQAALHLMQPRRTEFSPEVVLKTNE